MPGVLSASRFGYPGAMTVDLGAVIEAGMTLDPDERAIAAHRLLESLHEEQDATTDDVDAAWLAEVERRLEEILSGRARMISVENSHAEIRRSLAARRR